LATNNVPEAKTKSAPNTATIVAGKPNAQYGEEGLIRANNKGASPVKKVPKTGRYHNQRQFSTACKRLAYQNHEVEPADDKNDKGVA
jgi:hypothetical protein